MHTKYVVGNNDERFATDSFDTREEALEFGKQEYPDDGILWTGEALDITFENLINGMAEHINDEIHRRLEEEHFEGAADSFGDFSEREQKDLEAVLLSFYKKAYKNKPFDFDVINIQAHEIN
jgi:hypothetical protein